VTKKARKQQAERTAIKWRTSDRLMRLISIDEEAGSRSRVEWSDVCAVAFEGGLTAALVGGMVFVQGQCNSVGVAWRAWAVLHGYSVSIRAIPSYDFSVYG
jgi:hypothetical protein